MEGNDRGLEMDDVGGGLFGDNASRAKLHRQKSRLSPRRTLAKVDSFSTTTLPFYQDISPAAAVERMFDWFRGSGPDSIGIKEFNRLRQCLGKPVIDPESWKKALPNVEHVSREKFKLLFGPPPFFGGENVEEIVHDVMKSEETLHFAQVLVSRFGVGGKARGSSADDDISNKRIGLKQLQNIQRACCTDVAVFGPTEWADVIAEFDPPPAKQSLDWMQFAELFSVTINRKGVFEPHADPAAVVYAVLANDKLVAMLKDPDEDTISRTALTALLGLGQDDEGLNESV